MTDPKKIADGLRRYNAWRRNNDEDLTLEMPDPKELGIWIDSAIAVLDAHAENNDLAQRVEELEADARRWKAIKQRHSIALVRLATGSGSYNSSKAPAILDAWADMAAAEIEAFDPDAYLKEIESRIAAFEASEAAVSKKGIERDCCGTFYRSPHRKTCEKYRGKSGQKNQSAEAGD